jgi:CheY-like chemotaxis protein
MKYFLLVDDDPDDREILKEALGVVLGPVNVRTAEDGIQATNLLASSDQMPELIFLDLNMPRMGGIEFLRKLGKSPYKHIPVVICSTSALDSDKRTTAELGAQCFITKQNTFADLCAELKQLLTTDIVLARIDEEMNCVYVAKEL